MEFLLQFEEAVSKVIFLTAKNTKLFRKNRKDLFYRNLTLFPLRLLSVLCG